jgi:hypothetical protein
MAEFERHHAGEGVVIRSEGEISEDFDSSPFGILERQRVANAGRDVVASLALDTSLRQPCGDDAKVAAGRDLKGEARRFARITALECNGFRPRFGARMARSLSRATKFSPTIRVK